MIFTSSTQVLLRKDPYSSIFREDDERPAPTLPVVMPLPQFSTLVEHIELSSLDIHMTAGPDDIHPQMIRWHADLLAESLS